MHEERENPEALAGAHRVHVTLLAGNGDVDINTANPRDQQLRKLLTRYALSVPRAMVVAEHAFASGRRR
jgi:hypothetical protein